MPDRSDRWDIPVTEPRCSDRTKCAKADRCARRLSTVPNGTPLRDFALGIEAAAALWGCPYFIVAKEARPGRQEIKRRVHPPI